MKRLVEDKYGVLELNAVTFPRTGNIMAMYGLADSVISDEQKVEYGMLLAVDYANKEIKFATGTAGEVVMLHYSGEKAYNEQVQELDRLFLNKDEDFKPRLGKLDINDRFTTSTVCYDETKLADDEAIEAAVETGLYGKVSTTAGFKGLIELTTTKPTSGLVLQATKFYTIPNGDAGIQFAVVAL